MITFVCKRGKLEDAADLLDACRPYFKESVYAKHLRFSHAQAMDTFSLALAHNSYDFLVVYYNSQVAGVVITCYNASFFEGIEGNMDFFYILPDFRGTGAARALVAAALEEARRRGATVVYCGCHSGFDDGGRNNQLYVNLFKKHGFAVNGANMQLFMGE